MNDDDLAEWQMVYGFERGFDETNVRLVKHAAELGLTPWELSIFQAIQYDYGQGESKETLANYSHGRDNPKSAAAIERCFREGWIQFVTTEFERELRQELHDGGYTLVTGLFGHDALHEVQGGSVAGIISFGRRGAALRNEWGNTDSNEEEPLPGSGHWACGFDPDGRTVIYGTTIEDCKLPFESVWSDSSFKHPFTREPAVPVGRWCDRWWQRFESGFRVRYSCRSQYE